MADENNDSGVRRRYSGEGTLERLPTFITVDELAVLLRVNRKTAYEAVANGTVPGVHRIGRTIRITRDTVVGWLRGNSDVPHPSRRK